jgi:hypothetical protein
MATAAIAASSMTRPYLVGPRPLEQRRSAFGIYPCSIIARAAWLASDHAEVVIGMPAWLAALAEARVTAAENRAALGDTHPAVLPK